MYYVNVWNCGSVSMYCLLTPDHQSMVRFTPAVYKFLQNEKCSLIDLKAEDPTLYEYVHFCPVIGVCFCLCACVCVHLCVCVCMCVCFSS